MFNGNLDVNIFENRWVLGNGEFCGFDGGRLEEERKTSSSLYAGERWKVGIVRGKLWEWLERYSWERVV